MVVRLLGVGIRVFVLVYVATVLVYLRPQRGRLFFCRREKFLGGV